MKWVRQFVRMPAALASLHEAIAALSQRLEQMERDLRTVRDAPLPQQLQRIERDLHIVRDASETVRRRSGIILERRRAVALLVNGYQIYVDPQDHGGAVNLLTSGLIEDAEIMVLRRLLRPGSVMLDVGANYGYYSMVAAPYLRAAGKIIGFEPNPNLYELYRNSIHLNGFDRIIEARPFGISDVNGSIKFEIEPGYPGGGRIPRHDDAPRDGHQVIEVPVVRLDDHLPSDVIIDVVKIDVEAHEEYALKGMRSIIARSPDIVILMEFFFSYFRDEQAAREMIRLITEEFGLKMQRVLNDGSLVVADFDSLLGAECTLVLSRNGVPDLPDLTFHPIQFNRGKGAELEQGAVIWTSRPDQEQDRRVIVFGPYLHLPRGSYRVSIDADWEGDFVCRLQDNFGDQLMEAPIASELPILLELISDARALECVIECISGDMARMTLRKVEFRKV